MEVDDFVHFYPRTAPHVRVWFQGQHPTDRLAHPGCLVEVDASRPLGRLAPASARGVGLRVTPAGHEVEGLDAKLGVATQAQPLQPWSPRGSPRPGDAPEVRTP
jgi:hypothetical protein